MPAVGRPEPGIEPGMMMPDSFRAGFLTAATILAVACGPDAEPTGPAVPEVPAFHHAAAHLEVNSAADPGTGGCTLAECTLREAIAAANANPDLNEISFVRRIPGVITLAAPADGGGELLITQDLVITGPGNGIVVQRDADDPPFRIFLIENGQAGPSVRLSRLTLQGGASLVGGGIYNLLSDVTLTDCTVRGNIAVVGGGIGNGGDLIVRNCTISGNSAGGSGANPDNTGGGGIANIFSESTLMIENSTIADNAFTGTIGHGGAGLYNVGLMTVMGSTVSGNRSDIGGGGISENASFSVGGLTTVINSTVSGNSAGTFGGGILVFGDSPFQFRLILTNATVVDNTAAVRGGGLANDAEAPGMVIVNNIFALNHAPDAPDYAGGTGVQGFEDIRFNLVGIGDGSEIADGVDGNRVGSGVPIDPRLGDLAYNGGRTRTHAIKLDSPAVDAASTFDCPSTDQRGLTRPQGPVCDMGSYERQVRGGK